MAKVWLLDIIRLWRTFTKISREVDEELFLAQIVLDRDGWGEFTMRPCRTDIREEHYPAWAKKQIIQAAWDSLDEGVQKLRSIHYRQKEATRTPQNPPSTGYKPKGETA